MKRTMRAVLTISLAVFFITSMFIDVLAVSSTLYPENWYPGYKDEQGRFLQDFSYAGYHKGEVPIPTSIQGIYVDVTQSPYNADKTGVTDTTAAIQNAIDYVGQQGGGVVYLPAGTYKVNPQGTNTYALLIKYNNVVLRGEGGSTGSTKIYNDTPSMRGKNVILVQPAVGKVNWQKAAESNTVSITSDLAEMTTTIPVSSTSGFSIGDWVVVRTDCTDAFIADHSMTDLWNSSLGGIVFYRKITAIDTVNNTLTIDIPIRYWMKTRDNARVYKITAHLAEIGIENLSIGMRENLTPGTGNTDYNTAGTGAYEMHFSHVIYVNHTVDGWIKDVYTYKPSTNTTKDIHILSNGINLNFSRNITVDSCNFQKPEYRGDGGNGYLYTREGQENLIINSVAEAGRHNFTSKGMYSSGNVVYQCTTRNPSHSSDYHQHLSPANLIDNMTVEGDRLDADYRPFGTTLHGHTTTQSVFWNTNGVTYKTGYTSIVDSQQFGWGYVIGTRGNASAVTTPGGDNTEPLDYVEAVGTGNLLVPQSLYQDQLSKRTGTIPTPTPVPTVTPPPTTTPAPTPSSYVVTPVADAYIRDGSYANTNYGMAALMYVKKDTASGFTRNAYTKFDFSTFAGSSATSAKLRLNVASVNTDASRTINIYGTTDESWTETGITWNNAPAGSTLLGSITVTNTAGLWYELDVTSYINNNLSDKVVSFLLVNEGAATSKNDVQFNTKEASANKPELVIQ